MRARYLKNACAIFFVSCRFFQRLLYERLVSELPAVATKYKGRMKKKKINDAVDM